MTANPPPSNFSILRLSDPDGLEDHLRMLGWIEPGEECLAFARAGEGNMNLVVRVTTDRRSLILKQSRPWVEKYPQIAAPGDRLLVEAAFFQIAARSEAVADGMPNLLAWDAKSRSALIEDLGAASDYVPLYSDEQPGLEALIEWLDALHGVPLTARDVDALANRDMRRLNHAHIFDLPMSGAHGMDLDDVTAGLQAVAQEYRADAVRQQVIRELGEVYLSDGATLLHGDFYPGSWLETPDGPRVIDPEFCFPGPREFDLGVLKAHLLLAGFSGTRIESLLLNYHTDYDQSLADRFAGVEIMRRLIGVAQLPIDRSLSAKEALLDLSAELVVA